MLSLNKGLLIIMIKENEELMRMLFFLRPLRLLLLFLLQPKRLQWNRLFECDLKASRVSVRQQQAGCLFVQDAQTGTFWKLFGRVHLPPDKHRFSEKQQFSMNPESWIYGAVKKFALVHKVHSRKQQLSKKFEVLLCSYEVAHTFWIT